MSQGWLLAEKIRDNAVLFAVRITRLILCTHNGIQ